MELPNSSGEAGSTTLCMLISYYQLQINHTLALLQVVISKIMTQPLPFGRMIFNVQIKTYYNMVFADVMFMSEIVYSCKFGLYYILVAAIGNICMHHFF